MKILKIIVLAMVTFFSTAADSGSPREVALEQAISSLWAALSNAPGETADVATLRALFHPEARILGVNPRRDGEQLRVQNLESFLESFARPSAEGFYEREIYRSVEVYGSLAQVFCTVESRKTPEAATPNAVGVNSIQLHWHTGAWRIVSLYYHLEDEAQPIPARYRAQKSQTPPEIDARVLAELVHTTFVGNPGYGLSTQGMIFAQVADLDTEAPLYVWLEEKGTLRERPAQILEQMGRNPKRRPAYTLFFTLVPESADRFELAVRTYFAPGGGEEQTWRIERRGGAWVVLGRATTLNWD